MYSPGDPFIMVAPVVTSWAVAGQRMVFLHMYLQTRVTLEAFPVATPRGRSSSSHEGEQLNKNVIYFAYVFEYVSAPFSFVPISDLNLAEADLWSSEVIDIALAAPRGRKRV